MQEKSSDISRLKESFISTMKNSIFNSNMTYGQSTPNNMLSILRVNNPDLSNNQNSNAASKLQSSFVKIIPKDIKPDQNKECNDKKQLQKISLHIHGRNRIYKPKLTSLAGVCVLLEKIFKGEHIDDEKDLNIISLYINLVSAIICRKFHLQPTINLTDRFINIEKRREELRHLIKLALTIPSKKRIEENNKFVYKHTMKFLKAQFYTSRKLKYNKESEMEFYQHYFEDISKKTKKPLELFYDPLNITSKYSKKPKTISNTHILLIFDCNNFKAKFFEYIDTNFKEDYQTSIYKKFEKFLSNLESLISKSSDFERVACVEKFIEKLQTSKRCKFPWNSTEIDQALNHYAKHINKLTIKANYN